MFVLMGANGNVTSKLATTLCDRGKKVRVIGRNAERLKALQTVGAELAIGDASDASFLEQSFRGAQAVYVMIPPNYSVPDYLRFQSTVGEAIATAIGKSGVGTVVALSSIGAALPAGTGPIAGLHDQEQRLKKLSGIRVLHLRAAYFMENHLHAVPMIKAIGVYPGMIEPNVPFPMIASADIASYAAGELEHPTFNGQEIRHVLGPHDYTMTEAAAILGAGYVKADPAQAKGGMIQNGFSSNVADLFEEMSQALSDGRITKSIDPQTVVRTSTTLEQFISKTPLLS